MKKENGSILSNSWSIKNEEDLISDAINEAATSGRKGLGCIIVCSAGNDNTTVKFPANLSKTIAVGAIDRCGIRSGRIDIIPNSCDPWSSNSNPGSCYFTIYFKGSTLCKNFNTQ